jgi:Tol biopolymer transport system component/DNA-binding winged helix-turn-helix (wHTH) protein
MSFEIKHFYRFGDYTVDPDQKILLRNGMPAPLTPKVFDTLLILVENSGRLVKKEELMNRLWPDSFVEDANLTFNIQQLRKSLGDNARKPQFIETVPRRGYRFIADVEEISNGGGNIGREMPLKSSDRASEAGSAQKAGNIYSGDGAQTSWAAKPAVYPASARNSKKAILIAAALVLVLAGGGMLWRYFNDSKGNLREFVAGLPLKIEKLTATGESPHAAISADGKYLAYTQGFVNNQSIWLRQLATNTNIQIVPSNGPIYGLAFAHSGEYLYFVKGSPGALYRVSLLGDVPVKIVEPAEGRFSLSSDDRHIAFVRVSTNAEGQREYSLVIADGDGTNEHTLLTRRYPDKLDAPVWSPDNDSIICAYGNSAGGGQNVSLVEIRVNNGMSREMSAEKFANIVKIAWLPQKQGLIMSAAKNPEGYLQLWRISYPGMEFRQITAGSISYSDLSITASGDKIVSSQTARASDLWIGEGSDPRNIRRITAATDKLCWTPARQLIYSSRVSGNEDLWMMKPDGSDQRQLTVDTRINATPAVTPDSHYIVFMSNRGGVFQVWRMNIDGTNQVELTNGGGKNFPVVSPDGRWVLYNSTDNWDVWRTSIDGGEPGQVTDRPAFFPSISPDGKMIAALGRNESKAALLILPFAGGPPIKTFDLGGRNFSGTRIEWTPDGQSLVYAIEQDGVNTLVKQSLNGGPVQEITKFPDDVFDFGYSYDGQMLAVTRGGWQSDVVLIRDLGFH